MRVIVSIVLSVLALENSFAADKSLPNKSLPIPSDLVQKVQVSVGLGRALYVQDRVSAIGTDALIAKIGSLKGRGLTGYLTVQQGDESGKPLPYWYVFYFVDAASPKIAYRIKVATSQGQGAEVESLSPPQEPSPDYLKLFRARQTALKAAQPLTQPMNAAVLPAQILGEGGILVELLAGTQKQDTVVLGKHYRVIVSAVLQKTLEVA